MLRNTIIIFNNIQRFFLWDALFITWGTAGSEPKLCGIGLNSERKQPDRTNFPGVDVTLLVASFAPPLAAGGTQRSSSPRRSPDSKCKSRQTPDESSILGSSLLSNEVLRVHYSGGKGVTTTFVKFSACSPSPAADLLVGFAAWHCACSSELSEEIPLERLPRWSIALIWTRRTGRMAKTYRQVSIPRVFTSSHVHLCGSTLWTKKNLRGT